VSRRRTVPTAAGRDDVPTSLSTAPGASDLAAVAPIRLARPGRPRRAG
jgi:hypothetical protein